MAKRHHLYQRRILKLLRSEGEASRPTLARNLGLSLPTITNIVKQLLEHGIVMEADYKQSTGGRRAALLRLDPDYVHALGLEVSYSYLRGARVNLIGEIVDREEVRNRPPSSKEPELEGVVGVARTLLDRAPDGVVTGVGVGISGIVSHSEGVSVKFPRSENWVNVPLARLLTERLGIPTWLENDVQAAGSQHHRAGRTHLLLRQLWLPGEPGLPCRHRQAGPGGHHRGRGGERDPQPGRR
jgi:DNA-binding Lrp family transcriptional regulator